MTVTGSETELTTAATDLLLALVCLAGVLLIGRFQVRRAARRRASIWIGAFGFLAAAGLLGFAAHGLKLTPGKEAFLWHLLYLALAGTISLFAAGVLTDLRSSPLPRRAIAGLLAAGAVFYGMTVVFSGAFIVFIVYEAAALIFALGGYLYLRRRERERYSAWMAAGIAISIAAAAIQAAGPFSLRIVWEFDHNGLFHLVQTPGAALLIIGVLQPRN